MMNRNQAIEIFNDSMRRLIGTDQDGNEYTNLTGFGGFALSHGISYVSKHDPGSCAKAVTLLKAWAEILEKGE